MSTHKFFVKDDQKIFHWVGHCPMKPIDAKTSKNKITKKLKIKLRIQVKMETKMINMVLSMKYILLLRGLLIYKASMLLSL